METQFEPIPRFNDHGASCKGHANSVLDCEYKTREERDLLVSIINNYLSKQDN